MLPHRDALTTAAFGLGDEGRGGRDGSDCVGEESALFDVADATVVTDVSAAFQDQQARGVDPVKCLSQRTP